MSIEIKIEEEEWDIGEWCQVLVVRHNNKEIAKYYDKMEPEDALFCRDLDWIAPLLQKVYDLGVSDKRKKIPAKERGSYMCSNCSEAYMYCACLDNPLNKKNWNEDSQHENGNYTNICKRCKSYFIGHKRRVVCRMCQSDNTPI